MYIYKVYESDPDGEYDFGYYKSKNSAVERLKEEVIELLGELDTSKLSDHGSMVIYETGVMSNIVVKIIEVLD